LTSTSGRRPEVTIPDRGSRRVLQVSVAVGILLSIAATVAVASRWLLLGSFEGRWVYGYEDGASFTARAFLIVLLVSAVAAALLRWTVPHPTRPRRDWMIVLLWIAAALALQATLRSLTPFALESLFISDTANSFYGFSHQYDAGDLLSRFNRISPQAPWHARGNMPGKVMLVYALRLFTSRTDILPWLVMLVSNLGALLIYLFVRDLLEDRKTALHSAVLYLFVPAKLLFFPLMNTVTPVPVLACACILLRWLHTGRTWWPAALGICLYTLVFFEPLPLVMGLLFAALSLRAIAIGRISFARYAAQAAVVVIIFAATSKAVYFTTNFDLLRAFGQIGAHAIEFNATENRPYAVWLVGNLEEFLFGVGPFQAAAFAGALLAGLPARGRWRAWLARPFTALCLGLAGVLIAVDLIGVNRGEAIRLWIFLACFFQIPAAYVCARLNGTGVLALVVATCALQVAAATAMIRFVVP
jgi:hypothetical protein